MKKLDEYEAAVLRDIAVHICSPSHVQKFLSLAGKPVSKVLEMAKKVPALKNVPALVAKNVEKGLRTTISVSQTTYSENDIVSEFAKIDSSVSDFATASLTSLKIKDQVADRFNMSNAVLIGAEGAIMGVATSLCEFLPGAQLLIPAVISADVIASITFLSRHASQVAASYGFPASNPANIAHILAALAPASATSDEGYFAAKLAIAAEITEFSRFVGQNSARFIRTAIEKGEVPSLLRIIQTVASRLGLSITEKELAMLVPIAGAVMNGGINVAFQQTGHVNAKDYFRRLCLDLKYGAAAVEAEFLRILTEVRVEIDREKAS